MYSCHWPNRFAQRVTQTLYLSLSILVSSLFFFQAESYAVSLNVNWKASPDSRAVGYKLHYGTSTGNYAAAIDAYSQTSCNVTSLVEAKTYYFAASAYDAEGNTSPFSTEVAYTVPANTPPVATNGALLVTEDISTSGAVSATDAEGKALTFRIVDPPTLGSVILNNAATGAFTYTPTSNANGSDSFSFRANDGSADSNTGLVSVTISPVNDAPTAVADTAQTATNTAVSISVLANDTDPDGDTLSLTAATQGSKGTTALSGTAVRYTPSSSSFSGTDSFSYTVSDGHGGTATGSVTVTVQSAGTDYPDQISTNVAPTATITASSQNVSTGQTAAKAADQVVDGYPRDYTREWVTTGQKQGAWIRFTWPSARNVHRIVLNDRPNLNDNITGGTLTFSDGSTISVDALDNAGAGTEVAFDPISTTSVTFSVKSVGTNTVNVGLAEMQIFALSTVTPTNQAPLATITASSQSVSTGQTAVKAADGVVDGYPKDYSREWASTGEKQGAWIQFEWPSERCISKIILNDRPNLNDNITGGTLTFSDGTEISIGALDNSSKNYELTFEPKITSSVTFTVDSVASGTYNIGLAEIQIFGFDPAGSTNRAPIANAGRDVTVTEGDAITLDGTGSSDPDEDYLTYRWTQTSGTIVNISNQQEAGPSFTAPSGLTEDEVLTFELVVDDGLLSSTPDTVVVTVQPKPQPTNIASLAKVTASSQATSTGQLAVKAVDGVIDGYPRDYTREWATAGQKKGAWIKLTWSSAQSVSRVVLYDRPNLNDTITSGTLTFSDGSTVTVGALPNNGQAYEVTFPTKATSSVTFTVSSVGTSTANVGLAELEVFNY